MYSLVGGFIYLFPTSDIFLNMIISKNILNPIKKSKIRGNIFHLFYMDLNTSVLFDEDLTSPIIWGSKSIVIRNLKSIYKLLKNSNETSTITVISYILKSGGYKIIQTYNGKIKDIGKYIIRY